MQVTLTVVGGVHDGQRIPIRSPEFVIGRDPSCHLRPVSPNVSRRHCAIVQKTGRIFLRDYGSSNGTLLNDRMLLQGELQLESGDRIKVGPLQFTLSLTPTSETPAGPPHPKPTDDIHSTEAFSIGQGEDEDEEAEDTRLEL